jgi:Flp pilus assembly protein TadG
MRKFSERMAAGRNTSLFKILKGQSMVEFAMILPLFVLFIIGIFELGRAFFAYIAITNAAREGARVVTFWPGKATILNVNTAINTEIESSPMVTVGNIAVRRIECGNSYQLVTSNVELDDCPTEEPIRVTIEYNFDLILDLFFPSQITLRRSAEMMMP